VYDAVGYVLDADKAEQIASKLMSIIEGLRERARTPHKLAEAIGKTLSETARQEVVNLTGISLPEDFRVRMDTVLVRYILMSRFADLIESWRGSGEAVIDDVEEGGPTTDEVTEELYEMSISAVEANASLLTKIAWFLIFNAPPTLLVIDEAHHTPASSFIAAIMSLPKTAVLGMSATPYRGDKMDQLIYGLAGSIVARVSSSELILNNYLSLPVIVVDRYDISRDNPELYEQYDKTSKGIDVLLNAIATQDAEKIIASVRSLGDTISKILTGMDWDYVYNNLLQRKEVVDLIDEILSLTRERSEAMRTSQVFKAAAAARSISQKIKRLKDRLIAIAASALGVDISSREPIGLRTPREWMSTLVELFIVRLILDRFGIEEGIARTAVSRLKAHLKYVKTALAINAIVFNNKRTEHILSVVRTAIESRLWPVVVMSTYVKYAEILYKAFKDAGIPTGLVTGRTAVYFDGREEVRVGTAKRHEIYKMVRERRLQVLIGTTLLDEGIDIPEIVTLLLAYAYKSVVGTKQRVGRALRSIMASQENPNFFKPFALIVDMQDKHIRVTPSNCRIWWYCSEPLWIKTRAYYTAVPNLIRDLAKVGESVMGMPPSQKICRIYGELARISREYGRVPGEKGFAVVYGDWVCTDALDSLIRSVINETKSTCGGIDSGGIEKALNEVRSHAARLTVLKCEHPVTYTIGDVYASAKELYAKCIEQIEQLVC
jgi:superfamily II DNA or RNA helicase